MNRKIAQKIILSVAALLFGGLFGLVFGTDVYAESNADIAWRKCGAIATDSVFYYDCAKANLGLGSGLTESDLVSGSALYTALGGETSRGSFSFSDATNILQNNQSMSELDREATNCTKDASGWGWFACGLNKAAGLLTSIVYPKIQYFMSTDPTIFKSNTMETAWNRFRILADLVLVGMLMVMIISQVTGIGISNYGIKKSLPRLVVAAIVINLSFFLSRMAIDVANIIGDGIGAVFDGLTATAKAKINFNSLADGSSKTIFVGQVAGGGLLTGIMAFFATKTALSSGQSISLLIMTALISAVIGLLILLTVIQLRKALIILLTITSPVAVLLYILPGTKKTFNQWFGLFKGLLFAYPICTLMVKGGAFASNILTAAMGVANEDGSPNFFTMVIAVAASVIPIFLIPKTIIQSAGALGARLQGLANRLKGFAAGTLRNSALGQRLDRGAKERANRWRAGVDENGNETKFGKITRSRSERQRLEAAKRAQSDRALRRNESNVEEMARYEEMEQQADATEEMLASVSSDGEMESKISEIINSGGTAQDIAAQISGAVRHWNSINDKNAADDAIAAALDGLGDGRAANEIRREVARKRLADSDGMLKAKHGAMRQYYKSLASAGAPDGSYLDANGNPMATPKWSGNENQWVEKLVGSNDFNAEWLAGVAPPQINQLQNYMKTGTNDTVKQQIARTYGDMKKISAFQTATVSDYEGLEAEIAKYHPPTPPPAGP